MRSAVGVAGHERFLMIDGLRGIAAMMVVFFHFNEALKDVVSFPRWVHTTLQHGDLGVDVFFVLSGFVIPYSVRNGVHTPKYLAKFALRRSIRLDPPLWATLFLEVVLIRLVLQAYPGMGTPIPDAGQIAANAAYLQVFLGIDSIVTVLWSLTFEVQFYLVVVGSLVILHLVRTRFDSGNLIHYLASGLSVVAFAYSVLIWHEVLPNPLRGLFIQRWFQFYLGALAWLAVAGRIRLRTFVAASAFCLISALVFAENDYRFWSTNAALFASALIVWASLTQRMSKLLAGPTLQFLGKVSYSLYLLHLVTGWRFIALMKQSFGGEISVLLGTLVFAGGVAVSLVSAWAIYRVLEAPSMNLARKVTLLTARSP